MTRSIRGIVDIDAAAISKLSRVPSKNMQWQALMQTSFQASAALG